MSKYNITIIRIISLSIVTMFICFLVYKHLNYDPLERIWDYDETQREHQLDSLHDAYKFEIIQSYIKTKDSMVYIDDVINLMNARY